MEIVRGSTYQIKSLSSPRIHNWWAHPASKQKVKVVSSSLLPLTISGSVTVRADNKLDIQALQDAVDRSTNVIEPHRLSGFAFTPPVISLSLCHAENFEAEESITVEWLMSNGFVKTGRQEVDVANPIIELAE